jgi:hypothetical protein
MSSQPSSGSPSPPNDLIAEKAFQLDLWDHLFLLDLNLDIQSQLIAIRELLSYHRQASEAFLREIKEIEEHAKKLSGTLNDRAVDEWLDRVRHSVYQDAAHSMSAVGMLAPFIESLFHECYQGIGRNFFPSTSPLVSHDRWDAAHAVQWDCHFVIEASREPRKDLVRGVRQLADATGLARLLPKDLDQTLAALFGYRNKMFHYGFEWPLPERHRFARRISDENWPRDWFQQATSGDEPWIYYLSQRFVDHCLTFIEQTLDGFSAFVRDELTPKIRQG